MNITESGHAFGFLMSEAEGKRSRDNATLLSGQNLKAGAVLGKVLRGAASKVFAGTGNGVMTLDATNPVRKGAKVGDYAVTCTVAAANGGTFRVEDPDGYVLGDVAVGATFDDDIKFVIADGAVDFVVGDKFTVTIAAGSGKVKEYNPANQDGSEIPCGVLCASTDATSADQACAIVARDAEVNSNELLWFAGATAGQITTGAALLAAIGVIAR